MWPWPLMLVFLPFLLNLFPLMGQSCSSLFSSFATDHSISDTKTRSWFSRIGKTKTHPSHPHKLKLKSYKNPYNCDGCKELGFGQRYRCEKCDFNLHKDCMLATPTAHHDFFENSTFKILHQPPQNQRSQIYCNACARPVGGFVYRCEEKGWNLHPCCLNFQKNLLIESVNFSLSDKVSSKCIWCNKKKREGTVSGMRGWCYVSEDKKYNFHVHCAMGILLDAWRKGAFDGDDNSLASLEKVELPVQRYTSWNLGSRSTFMKMIKMVFKAIVATLLGDPTGLLTKLFVELVAE